MIRYSFFSFLSGLLFALGLSVSGMTEPGLDYSVLLSSASWQECSDLETIQDFKSLDRSSC